MAEIKVSNLHECAWYITRGAEIKAIEGYEVNSRLKCEVYFTAPNISELQAQYFRGEAEANIFDFQRAYQQINAHITEAKRQLKRKKTEAEREAHDEA